MNRVAQAPRQNERGFTLAEMMIAITMSTAIIGVAFTTLIVSQKGNQIASQVTNAQSTANTGLDMLVADLKLAGFGMDRVNTPIGNCHINGVPSVIVPNDNTPGGPDTGPDSVSLLVPLTNSVAAAGALWQVNNPGGVPPLFNTIQLPAGVTTAMIDRGLALGSIVSLGGAATGVVNAIGGTSLGFAIPIGQASPFDAQVSFNQGTLVYLLQCVTYQVIPPPDALGLCGGNAPCLVRGLAPLALPGTSPNCNVAGNACVNVMDGVEDLQLSYACDGCDPRPTSNATAPGIPDGQMDDLDQSGTFNDPGDFISQRNWFQTAAPFGNYMTTDKIHLVQVSLVARQAVSDQGSGEGNVSAARTATPLIVGNDHNHANGVFAPGDNATPAQQMAYLQLRRRLVNRTIELRNQRF